MAKTVIFTADDFGLCAEVNEAVERAHRDGVLSAASLMVGAPAAEDAVARAKKLPNLRVGLHLTLVEGRPVLPASEVPALVDESGNFLNDLLAAGVRWFFLPQARAQLRREVRAQFDAFRATGLALDHVNAHNHMHLHPTVLSFILENSRAPVRVPHEPPAGLLAPWLGIMRRRLTGAGVRMNDAIVGMHDSGHLTADHVMARLNALPDGTTEFYFHPAIAVTPFLEATAPGYDRPGELAALLSTEVRATLRNLGLKPLGFSDLILSPGVVRVPLLSAPPPIG